MDRPIKKAVVLCSGGLDSSTCLAWAKSKKYACYALSFNYGQRHQAELIAASRVSGLLGVVEHKTLQVDLAQLGGSALTDLTIAVPEKETAGIPITYVPARNTIFLSLALAYAEVIDADIIVLGVNAVDYSGYPDCRPEYIAAFQQLANLATQQGVEGRGVRIEAPLLHLSKAEIIQLGVSLGLDYRMTVSCYQADAVGRACGVCDSCRLRKEGFLQAGIEDTTQYMIQ